MPRGQVIQKWIACHVVGVVDPPRGQFDELGGDGRGISGGLKTAAGPAAEWTAEAGAVLGLAELTHGLRDVFGRPPVLDHPDGHREAGVRVGNAQQAEQRRQAEPVATTAGEVAEVCAFVLAEVFPLDAGQSERGSSRGLRR